MDPPSISGTDGPLGLPFRSGGPLHFVCLPGAPGIMVGLGFRVLGLGFLPPSWHQPSCRASTSKDSLSASCRACFVLVGWGGVGRRFQVGFDGPLSGTDGPEFQVFLTWGPTDPKLGLVFPQSCFSCWWVRGTFTWDLWSLRVAVFPLITTQAFQLGGDLT